MNQIQQLKFLASREEIASTYEPFIHKRFNPSSAQWKRINSHIRNEVLLRYLKERIKSVIGSKALLRYWTRRFLSWQSFHRNQTGKGEWDFHEALSTEGPTFPHVWGNKCMLARNIGWHAYTSSC